MLHFNVKSLVVCGVAAALLVLLFSGTGVAVSVPTDVIFESAPVDSHTFAKYLDPVTLPAFMTPTGDIGGVPLYELDITQYTRFMSSQFANPTTLFGYAMPGQTPQYLGSTFVVNQGDPIYLKVTNKLPAQDLLFPIDTTIMGGTLTPRTDVHLHGGHDAPVNDGGPLDWFSPDPNYVPDPMTDMGGVPGNSYTYYYPNLNPAALLWYHEHALGATRINTYLGLAGGYLIRDAAEAALNLPSVATGNETAFVLQDRDFSSTNQLWYPLGPDMLGNGDPYSGLDPSFPKDTSYSAVPEHFGNTIVVNGTVWPYMDVEQNRIYRVHLLEGSSARAYDLYLVPEAAVNAANQTVDLTQALSFYKIGTDQGLMDNAELTNHVIFMPGQRLDTLFDFTGLAQGNYLLINRAPDGMDPFGTAFADLTTTGQVLQIRVGANVSGADTFNPAWLTPGNPWATLNPADAVKTRQFTLTEGFDQYGRLIQFVNGTPYLNDMTMMPNIMAEPVINTTEIWQWMNLTMDNHPMHTHDVPFQVLGFQALMVDPNDPTMFMPMVDPNAPFIAPGTPEWDAWVAQWGGDWWTGELDTMICPPGYASTIILHFNDFTGDYVAHCHILEHEEHDMMGTFRVVPEPSSLALIATGILGFALPIVRRFKK